MGWGSKLNNLTPSPKSALRYQMVKSEVVKEYGAKVTLYKHKKTGAEVMSVSVDDDNKVGACVRLFCVCGVGGSFL